MSLWGGVFLEPTDDDLRRLNDSLPFDRRLAHEDVMASIAYARAIGMAGVLSEEETALIVDGLQTIQNELTDGAFSFQAGDEDIHSAVERRLIELVGDVGGKLHTGRSRNDQVATDFRLWGMQAIDTLTAQVKDVQRALVQRASTLIYALMPGYTHLQPAQPISAAHWLMSYFWMLARDVERLQQARNRTAVCPLGAGALAGTPLSIDREDLAWSLGFRSITENSLDAVSDRDFVLEALFIMATIGLHLSRLAEDIILFSNPTFGYVRLHDRYSTGSSLMPQKRNADPMELTRGKAGRLIGNLTGLMTVLKGLPTGYNKDMQEDKEALFDSYDTLSLLLPVVSGVLLTLTFDEEAMRRGLSEEMLATEMADYLVAKGLPFRQAHHIVGRIVRVALDEGVSLSKLPLDLLQSHSELFEEDVAQVFDFERSVARRRARGGTAPDAIMEQITLARTMLGM
ncbi:argininosuccinate lyase [Aggregatilineales bacterium SYSU G02658]